MFSDHIKIRADLQSYQYLPAKRVNVKLPDPLANLVDSLPNINESPKYETSTEANLDLLKKFKNNSFNQIESLDEIAQLITKQLKKPPTVLPPKDMGTLKRKDRRNVSDLHNVTQYN